MKKVLFIGNSFIFFNELPKMLEALAKEAGDELKYAEVLQGGAYLHDFLVSGSELNKRLCETYASDNWDFIILQEQSRNPAIDTEDFLKAASELCKMMNGGAKFLFYSTWAYKDGSTTLAETGMTYDEMLEKLTFGYAEGAKQNGGIRVPVGDAFAEVKNTYPMIDLYDPNDFYHPRTSGSYLAACLFYQEIFNRPADVLGGVEKLSDDVSEKLRKTAVKFFEK